MRNVQRVKYFTDTRKIAEGVLRSMQKYAAIALTNVGTDKLRPWLGTSLPKVALMNIHDPEEIKLFVRDQLREAGNQLFILQNEDSATLLQEDLIDGIEVVSVTIDTDRRIIGVVRFYPVVGTAIEMSVEV
jgi:hypothetical protein